MAWTRPYLVLALGLVLAAAGLKAAAVPAPEAPAQSADSGVALTVTLKDHQTAHLFLKNYDHFYLTAFNSKGTRFDIPWTSIASLDSPDLGGELATLRGFLGPEPAAVNVVVEARRPSTAFALALFPGVLVHGAGFSYVGDHDTFVDLASAEAFGVVLAGVGAYLQAYPNTQDSSKAVPQDLLIGGAAVFAVSWLWDLGFSPGAARALDESKGLALEPAARGAQLAYHF